MPLALLIFAMLISNAFSQEAKIIVHADKKLFSLSDMMVGANMEDLHYQMVGGFDSQLIHGESFFEPSPTQLVSTSLVAGFDNCGNSVKLDKNELALAKETRLTSHASSAGAAIELMSAAGAGLAICVSPNHSDNKWEWYSGYTAEVFSDRIVLSKADRAGKHREVASAPFTADGWIRLQLSLKDATVHVSVNGQDLIVYHDENPLPAGLWAIVARSAAQFRGDFHPNPLLETPGDAISLRWAKIQSGSATGDFALSTKDSWFSNSPSQNITFTGGEGDWGIDNAGLKRWGIPLVAGNPYEGFLRVKTTQPTEFWVSLRKADGTIIAEQKLQTEAHQPGSAAARETYQKLSFSLTPTQSDPEGRFAISLRNPGSITVGYAFLQPGEWGRFKGLPVRKDLAEALKAQGIRVLRFNGGMIEVPGYRWKKMCGPRDERPPYDGFYDRYCSSGLGPAEAVALGQAMGLPVIVGLNLDEKPEDVADFVAKCRPPFYQIANESPFDRYYVDQFKRVAKAVWKVAPDITLVTTSAKAPGNELHLELAEFARKNGKSILFDCHSFDGVTSVKSIASFARWMKEKAPHASVGILEFNAGAFDFQRGLNHALEMNATFREGDVIRATGTPNVSQPWGLYQTDWKAVLWTQGNIYYTPTKVWFQAAYYVDQMIAESWAPEALAFDAPASLDVFAAKSTDGSRIVLRVVNDSEKAQEVAMDWQGVTLASAPVRVTTLVHDDLSGYNSVSQPEKIKPSVSTTSSDRHVFPPHSFTVLEAFVNP